MASHVCCSCVLVGLLYGQAVSGFLRLYALIPMCVACSCLQAFSVCCFSCVFCVPSLPPPFPFFLFFFFSTDLFSVTGAQGCCRGRRVGGSWLRYRLGRPLGWSTFPGWGLCVVRGFGHWAPNLHLRLTLLTPLYWVVREFTI